MRWNLVSASDRPGIGAAQRPADPKCRNQAFRRCAEGVSKVFPVGSFQMSVQCHQLSVIDVAPAQQVESVCSHS